MKKHDLNNWVQEELTRISSVAKQLFKSNDALLFEMTKNLGWVCLALRHMRQKAYILDATPRDWDRIVERNFPNHKVRTINLYVAAGQNLHWDIELINKFQALVPAEIVDYEGTPLEKMGDQLRRLGLVTPAQFEEWAQTNEDAKQKAAREEEEEKQRIQTAALEKAREEREEKERIVRAARAQAEAKVRQLEEEKASAEEIALAQEAVKTADALDPKYERMLDKLIAQSQGFYKMETLFKEIETMLDLLPLKKVEAFRRNVRCVARIGEVLFPGGLDS